MRLAGFLSLGILLLAALAPGAAAAPPRVTYAEAKLEADREAKQLCHLLPKGCGEYASRCSRLSPRKLRCKLVAREGREVGDLVYTNTMHYYRTTRGKFVKELVAGDQYRIGERRRSG
ncbi:MAG TPA: hypothetical protein VD741_08945 [Solirubrobacterales bacterium]|nr:hypothetical protein [Solirubrobacterales bacterium]